MFENKKHTTSTLDSIFIMENLDTYNPRFGTFDHWTRAMQMNRLFTLRFKRGKCIGAWNLLSHLQTDLKVALQKY